MTAVEFLEELACQGLTLAAEGDGIRVRPASRLTEVLREGIREHKAELLPLLCSRWDQVAADSLVSKVLSRLDVVGWPRDADARRRLGLLMDRVDERWLVRDLTGLRAAVALFLAALDARASAPGAAKDDDAAWICRAIEKDQGLPPGSLTLWSPHKCSAFCHCRSGRRCAK
jgi:hypothetical protein